MVSAFRVDTLTDPTTALQELYETFLPSDDSDFPQVVSRHFSKVFSTLDAFQEIPTLDVRNPPDVFPDRSLVRFRAMVQDTSPSSEMYLAKMGNGSCGGWGIEIHDQNDTNRDSIHYADLRECTVVWAVNVPGESAWCAQELDGDEFAGQASQPHKPQRAHKFPHPDVDHIGVQVKVYDTHESENMKSTDIITFVGILTSEPIEFDLDTPLTVPTLHVLFSRPHSSLLTRPYPLSTIVPNSDKDIGISDLRTELIQWIAEESLGGDTDAAEWVLLGSIARSQSRNPPLLPPSVSLTQFPSHPSSAVSKPTLSILMELLFPLTHTLPLSLSTLNKELFSPESRDEDLYAGILQLPHRTVLLVTEGGVQEGKLVERGLRNIHTLQEIMSTQTLAYSFPFSQFVFPTDISCVVFAEGRKSAFFKTDIDVPFRPKNTTLAAADLYKTAADVRIPSREKLATFRDLVVGAHAGKVQVTESTSEYIQSDFVRERQQNNAITADDLIRRMTIAKLYALSLHKEQLTIELWERSKALDERRRARMA